VDKWSSGRCVGASVNKQNAEQQFIIMKIRNKAVQCLVDTGSVSSVISKSLVDKLRLPVEINDNNKTLLAATGKPLQVIGSVNINFHLKGLIMPHNFIVVEELFPQLILGGDFLRKNNASICYADNTVRFYNDLIIAPLQRFSNKNNCAIISQTVCLPKFSEAIIFVKVPTSFKNNHIILEPFPNVQNLVAVANSISNVNGNNIATIKVLNFKPHSIALRKRTKIASIVFPENILAITPFKMGSESAEPIKIETHAVLDAFYKEYKLDLNPNLNEEERYAFLNLLYQYRDVLARSLEDVKVYKDFQLDLELKHPHCKAYTR